MLDACLEATSRPLCALGLMFGLAELSLGGEHDGVCGRCLRAGPALFKAVLSGDGVRGGGVTAGDGEPVLLGCDEGQYRPGLHMPHG